MNTGLNTTLFKTMQTNKNKIFVIWIKHHTNEYIGAILTTNVNIISISIIDQYTMYNIC